MVEDKSRLVVRTTLDWWNHLGGTYENREAAFETEIHKLLEKHLSGDCTWALEFASARMGIEIPI
jgi:hypothetical protein